MLFFNLEVLKEKPTKSIWIVVDLKLSKYMLLGQKIEKQPKIGIHIDLYFCAHA